MSARQLEKHGSDWANTVAEGLGSLTLGQLVQTPSTIYSKFVTQLTGGYDIEQEPTAKLTGIAHITGGGQPSKLRRMLEPSGFGALIDDPIPPPAIMLAVQGWRSIADRAAYSKWHMGPGMILATPEPEKVCEAAEAANAEAQVIGKVTENPRIRIKNCGIVRARTYLDF